MAVRHRTLNICVWQPKFDVSLSTKHLLDVAVFVSAVSLFSLGICSVVVFLITVKRKGSRPVLKFIIKNWNV